MDYKKLYKEALERARDLHDNHPLGQPQTWITCEKIFPELRESEDERNQKIKKEVIEMLHYYHSKSPCFIPPQFSLEETLAWLEKQGEKKPSWSEEDEKMLNSIIEEIRPFGECPDYPTDEDSEYYYNRAKMIDWLKSLKPNHWKPSYEEIRALESLTVYAPYYNQVKILNHLLDELKKL